jgi:hypothetical protein
MRVRSMMVEKFKDAIEKMYGMPLERAKDV